MLDAIPTVHDHPPPSVAVRLNGTVISDDPAERWMAYAEANIRIWHSTGELIIRPELDGSVRGNFPEVLSTTVHVVTAQNPGRQVSEEENLDRHARLGDRLMQMEGVCVRRAVGGDVEWQHSELSYAIVGLTDAEAINLGREFQQEAVFAWRANELVVLSCKGGGSVSLGWSLAATSA
jgi:hypothetical protein